MAKVLVVGAGPAGLAAAERLLAEGKGRHDVTVVTLEPYLGGSAASYTTKDGRVVEQGQHIMAGFYREMRGLLSRSGVDPEATTSSNRGHVLVHEDRDGQTHHLQLGVSSPRALVSGLAYTGFSLWEKIGFAACFTRGLAEVARGVPEEYDDLCFSAWCLERGLPPSVLSTNAFRASREAQFNWPGEISAYSILQALREMGRDYTTSEVRFPMGSMSDIWWEPVARRIEALGGRIVRGRRLSRILHDGRRATGLVFDRLNLAGLPEDFLDDNVPVEAKETWRGFDVALLAICPGSMQNILKESPGLTEMAGFAGIPRVRTVSPMGLHVWHREAVANPVRTLVLGLKPPFAIAVDNKPFNPAYRDDARFGSVLHFVGQETGFEDWTDVELLDRALNGIRQVDGYRKMDRAGVLAYRLCRDKASFRRYWNSEPGSLKYKPWPRTPLAGMWLAGDWVRSDNDFPCMEMAIRSGRDVARQVLADLAHHPPQASADVARGEAA